MHICLFHFDREGHSPGSRIVIGVAFGFDFHFHFICARLQAFLYGDLAGRFGDRYVLIAA